MRRRVARATGLLAVLLIAGVAFMACGSAGSDPTAASTAISGSSSSEGLCDLLQVPLRSMATKHLTFAAVVARPASEDRGVGSMVALLLPKYRESAGEFEPVLSFLEERGTLEVQTDHPALPTASKAVVRNAAALDEFIADGGCG